MNKVYVITRIGWEYNDENYYRANEGGVTMNGATAYRSKINAQLACNKLNLSAFKELANEIGNYGNDYSERLSQMVTDYDKFIEICKAYDINPELNVESNWNTPNKFITLTDQQLLALIPVMNIAFYEVNEVEMKDES